MAQRSAYEQREHALLWRYHHRADALLPEGAVPAHGDADLAMLDTLVDGGFWRDDAQRFTEAAKPPS